jgi:hypothetical protein
MKKILLLIVAIVGLAFLQSCSSTKKTEQLYYDLSVKGTALISTSVVDINENFTNIKKTDNSVLSLNDSLAILIHEYQKASLTSLSNDNDVQKIVTDSILTDSISGEISKLLKWVAFKINVDGYIQEAVFGFKFEVAKEFIYNWPAAPKDSTTTDNVSVQ